MMAQPAFPPGMAPGHPGMGGPGHPMAGMQHPGGHMGGHPGGPGMMQGMHPGVSGPQVTQGPMVSGMPQGPGTPAPGHMPGNSMAMAHLGPQHQMFQQQNPQMNFGQMPGNPQQMQQQAVMRQRMLQQMHAQQQGGMPMNMVNNPNFNQAQMAQMKMNMPQMQQMQQMQQNPHMQGFRNQQQHQQQLMAAHAAQQQAQMQAQQQRAQQMQLSRSQEQQQQQQQQQPQPQPTPQQQPAQPPSTQPPQSHPTPTPQSQPQSQPTPQAQPTPTQTPVSQNKAQPPPPPTSGPNTNQQTPQPQPAPNHPTPQIKQGEGDEEPQIKQQEQVNAMMMQDIPKEQGINGQCILQLILFQDSLACPSRPQDMDWWNEIISKYFSPFAQMRVQLYNIKSTTDKSFLLQFASLARFYHAHFVGGIKQILLSSYDHAQKKTQSGETIVQSSQSSLTYVFNNDIRVSTSGSISLLFDEFNKIVRFDMTTIGWEEYIPRAMASAALQASRSPQQNSKQSPKMNKNVKKLQQQNQPEPPLQAPSSGVNEWGITPHIQQFLEVAEVLTTMAPLLEYFHSHNGLGAHETLHRFNQENSQSMANANANRAMQNQMARAANGQMQFPNQAGMNGPNQFASPGMAHLGLPQNQSSPHLGGPNHTPSPAQNAQGGVPMMHQMSAQGSNLSGSQGPSTTTSPNVSNKRRRPSTVKAEDDNANANIDGNQNKVKPSPRIGGKRQKAG